MKHACVVALCAAPLVALVTPIVSGLQTANGNVEAKVVCFYRRRDISSTLIALADKHASECSTITQPIPTRHQEHASPGIRPFSLSTFCSFFPLQRCDAVTFSRDFSFLRNRSLLVIQLDCKACSQIFYQGVIQHHHFSIKIERPRI